MKKLLFLMVVLAISNSMSSQNLNAYKYAYVPSKFTFLKEVDKFKLNSLTKLFMQKYGFETYLESDTAPFDFTNTNCNKVYVDLIKNNSVFLTKLKVILKDCNGNVLFTSKEGSSKEKELRVAYNEALREAFASFQVLNHKYDEKIIVANPTVITAVKEVYRDAKVAVQELKEPTSPTATEALTQLYAQPIQNGFQLVNSEPKVIMKLYKTSIKDFYTAVKGDLQGVFVSKNGQWYFEYYQNDKLISEMVAVKF